MDAKSKVNRARGGFTLIELLAVIVIIGILAAMISAAAWTALDTAKSSIYSMEMSKIRAALEDYKRVIGEYPPDFTDEAAVTAHIRRAFPNYDGNWQTDLGGVLGTKDQASALVFWLGGMPASSGSTRLTGFSNNPRNPFEAFDPSNPDARIGPFFEFKPERLGYEGGSCKYFAEEGRNSKFAPYVYFRARRIKGAEYDGLSWTGARAEWGATMPHKDTRLVGVAGGAGDWIAADSFQIHCPGIDGKHGPGVMYPDGTDYNEFDLDDQTDFSNGPLKDKMP